jgi:Secretion system C-terminal sorting domain/PA domain
MTKIKIVIIALCLITHVAFAQTPRVDTIVLSVYNTSQRFMLYPMPFGSPTPPAGFTAEMVASLDTVHVLREVPDSAGTNVPTWVTERVCGKIAADLTGKVALLPLNPACDLSTQVLNAQNAGASRVVLIHTTNNRDSVQLPITGVYPAASRITIPCYTVRQGIGEQMGLLLPSMVGITILAPDDSSRSDIQNRVTMPSANPPVVQPTVETADGSNAVLPSVEILDLGWRLAPNPTTDELTIHYQFAEQTATSLELFHETGQLVTSYELTPAQSGQFVVKVADWHTGTYTVRMRHGLLKDVKRFVVIH